MTIHLHAPLNETALLSLTAGDLVLISGPVYTARDAAHQKMAQILESGRSLPFAIRGQIIYYAGPCPTPPGKICNSLGPTTSGRMDIYTPALLAAGLKAMLGKGRRSLSVIEACRQEKAVYLAVIGGAAALTAQSVLKNEIIAWPELGPEAVHRLEIRDLPAIVINDCQGRDFYGIRGRRTEDGGQKG